MTQKSKTPLLWKVLSKEFKSYLNFGIVKQSSGKLYEQLKVSKLPTILGFSKNIKTATEYNGEMSPHKVRNFLRSVINKENKEYNFEIIGYEEYQETDCDNNDKKICFIVVENSKLTT